MVIPVGANSGPGDKLLYAGGAGKLGTGARREEAALSGDHGTDAAQQKQLVSDTCMHHFARMPALRAVVRMQAGGEGSLSGWRYGLEGRLVGAKAALVAELNRRLGTPGSSTYERRDAAQVGCAGRCPVGL